MFGLDTMAEKLETLDQLGIPVSNPKGPDGVIILDTDGKRGRALRNRLIHNRRVPIVMTTMYLDRVKRALYEPQNKQIDTVVAFTSPGIRPDEIIGLNHGAKIVIVGNPMEAERKSIVSSYAYLYDTHDKNRLYRNIERAIEADQQTDSELFDNVTGLSLYIGGNHVSTSQMFEIFYHGLDRFILLNLKERKELLRRRSYIPNIDIERALVEWRNNLPKDAIAVIETPDGHFRFDVYSRTNMEWGMVKKPSILYLRRDQNDLILRSAITHNPDVVWSVFGESSRKMFKRFYRAMYDGNIEEMEPSKYKPYLMIAEPYLLAALEQLYSEGGPRITPHIKMTEIGPNSGYYLRPWLRAVRDRSLEELNEALAEHLAALNSYGLFEVDERKSSHYAVEDNIVVNLDPDLILYLAHENKGRVFTTDLHKFCEEMVGAQPLFHALYESGFKHHYWETRRTYGDANYRQRFFDALPNRLEDSILYDLMI